MHSSHDINRRLHALAEEMLECSDLTAEEMLRAEHGQLKLACSLAAYRGCKMLTLTETSESKQHKAGDLKAMLQLAFSNRLSDCVVPSLSTEDEKSVTKYFVCGPESPDALAQTLEVMELSLTGKSAVEEMHEPDPSSGPGENWLQV